MAHGYNKNKIEHPVKCLWWGTKEYWSKRLTGSIWGCVGDNNKWFKRLTAKKERQWIKKDNEKLLRDNIEVV
jgi:hypothetical protein